MINKLFLGALPLTLTILLFVSACSRDEAPQSPPDTAQMTEPQSETETSSNAAVETSDDASDGEPAVAEAEEPVIEEQKSASAEVITETTVTESTMQATAPATGNSSPNEEQLALARKSGCLACHAVDKKLVGPAWRDVSARYKNDANAKAKLVAKVSKGGSGNWSDVVGTAAMPPYSPRVSEQNINLLVEFILSLEQ